jgi:c(7)-type cytochrome triheme protein
VKDKAYRVTDVGNVTFSHTLHTGMYRCGECHADIYLPENGNKTATMAGMERGESCGACHDGKIAFTVKENCDRCHR